jgi:hypothetical protein
MTNKILLVLLEMNSDIVITSIFLRDVHLSV